MNLIEQVYPSKKLYCVKCGSLCKMVEEKPLGFDPSTGEEVIKVSFSCPQFTRIFGFANGHSNYTHKQAWGILDIEDVAFVIRKKRQE